jgi:hypothetical protein
MRCTGEALVCVFGTRLGFETLQVKFALPTASKTSTALHAAHRLQLDAKQWADSATVES